MNSNKNSHAISFSHRMISTINRTMLFAYVFPNINESFNHISFAIHFQKRHCGDMLDGHRNDTKMIIQNYPDDSYCVASLTLLCQSISISIWFNQQNAATKPKKKRSKENKREKNEIPKIKYLNYWIHNFFWNFRKLLASLFPF